MSTAITALRMFVWMTLLTGAAYPLVVTGIAQLILPKQAGGCLIQRDDKIVGAARIGQQFSQDKYFWGRPSASDYNGLQSGGSNLSLTSAALHKQIEERRAKLIKAHGIAGDAPIPSDLLYASGSGLDPHISLAAARFQADRVIKARGELNEESRKVMDFLIEEQTQRSWQGNSFVNVLLLNIALDEFYTKSSKKE